MGPCPLTSVSASVYPRGMSKPTLLSFLAQEGHTWWGKGQSSAVSFSPACTFHYVGFRDGQTREQAGKSSGHDFEGDEDPGPSLSLAILWSASA